MAWLEDASSERVDQAVFNYRMQYGTVGKLKADGFQSEDFADTYSDETEVVRRIRQNVVSRVWPGLTEAYARTMLETLRADSSYKNPTAKWNGAGGYDVSATRVLSDPAGWSTWMSLEDSEEAWGS
ncbi:MAG: hypothetical protein BWY06_03396 [Candidatus Latescibacteria bacterium ADurb.Bin168]|nr:MAG: hypothetical protein BWY06_03396 [Candidatus Latescibacteria bacterium ADurb.Bin168]